MKQDASVARRRPRRRTIILIAVVAIFTPLIFGGIYLFDWANSPAEETIGSSNQAEAENLPETQTVQSDRFAFEVPSGFRIRKATDPTNQELVHTQAYETYAGGRQIGVTVNLLPSDGLSGVADYHMRQTTTERYTHYSLSNMPLNSKAFKSLDASDNELTIFITQGVRYASISVSGGGSMTDLQTLFTQVYTTWHWL